MLITIPGLTPKQILPTEPVKCNIYIYIYTYIYTHIYIYTHTPIYRHWLNNYLILVKCYINFTSIDRLWIGTWIVSIKIRFSSISHHTFLTDTSSMIQLLPVHLWCWSWRSSSPVAVPPKAQTCGTGSQTASHGQTSPTTSPGDTCRTEASWEHRVRNEIIFILRTYSVKELLKRTTCVFSKRSHMKTTLILRH